MEKNTTGTGAAKATNAVGETINFDVEQAGCLPHGWMGGVTGSGTAKWLVASGIGAFPWCVRPNVALADGFVEVKFKPVSGNEDQAGGVVWRWKDGDNYYVARANALENNVSLYYTEGGRRITIKYVNAPVSCAQWHTLRAEFAGKAIRILLDGKACIAVDDAHIGGPGAAGLWTKADSVTMFDDFAWGALPS
jgi:hypothetical protein